jgi:hypothetical protein
MSVKVHLEVDPRTLGCRWEGGLQKPKSYYDVNSITSYGLAYVVPKWGKKFVHADNILLRYSGYCTATPIDRRQWRAELRCNS